MRSIAIITARGGSKRIPRKNIKDFCGQPIIKYSIDSALKSNVFDEVMVSTDDLEIRDTAIRFGASVPFLRSQKTADDYATSSDVIIEVLEMYEMQGMTFDAFCCLYPTAPFVTATKLCNAMEILWKSEADSVMPVTKFSYPPQRGFTISNNLMNMLYPQYLNTRSQDLEPIYHDCGQFYCARVSTFLREKKLYMKKTVPIIFSEAEAQDIDTEVDWLLAELKFRKMGWTVNE